MEIDKDGTSARNLCLAFQIAGGGLCRPLAHLKERPEADAPKGSVSAKHTKNFG